jgi:hypothetical protein
MESTAHSASPLSASGGNGLGQRGSTAVATTFRRKGARNEIEVGADVARIWLLGRTPCFTLIDARDVPLVLGRYWFAHRNGNTTYVSSGPSGERISLHRVLLQPERWQCVDHIDHDGLNNRRSNLRVCTNRQNQWNAIKLLTRGSSRFKGVQWCGVSWRAFLRIDARKVYLGSFATEEEAAHAYDDSARQHRGAFAPLNFPRPGEVSAIALVLP